MNKRSPEKYVEIVKETERSVIATIWTGANYYIDIFPQKNLDHWVECAKQEHHFMTREDVIRNTSVTDMLWLCRTEDFTEDLLNETIQMLVKAENT